jgi:polyisoprenyl-teichoic acid--peptidoglycan teichoic acid transferase
MFKGRALDWTILLLCFVLSATTMALNWRSPVARALLEGESIRGVIIGSDYEDYARHADTVMVVSFDPQSRFLDVLSVPRDTRVSLPDRPSVKRINEVFAYEFRHSGRDFTIASLATKSVVETLLSSGAVRFPLPYFFTVDYAGFRTLIDAMGGVQVRVTEPMHYDDSWGKLHIHFEPGIYRLDGKKALEYVRFRGKSADQGRVRRQQIFFRELLKGLRRPTLLWRLPDQAKSIFSAFYTNLTLWDMMNLLLEARHLRSKDIRLISLPVTPVGNMVKVNPDTTQKIIALMQSRAVGADRGSKKWPVSEAAWRGKATVEVWNASDKTQAAKIVMRFLRSKGFDVVKIGDFSTRQQQTLVLDRSGDLRPAQAVAEALRDGANAEVVSRPEPSLHVDVSVVLGNDYHWPEKGWGW